jgi:hypothetical protein
MSDLWRALGAAAFSVLLVALVTLLLAVRA